LKRATDETGIIRLVASGPRWIAVAFTRSRPSDRDGSPSFLSHAARFCTQPLRGLALVLSIAVLVLVLDRILDDGGCSLDQPRQQRRRSTDETGRVGHGRRSDHGLLSYRVRVRVPFHSVRGRCLTNDAFIHVQSVFNPWLFFMIYQGLCSVCFACSFSESAVANRQALVRGEIGVLAAIHRSGYHHSIIPSFHHSIIPSFHHSIIPSFHHSIIPSFR
jgi:hypothetical protein